MSEVAYRVSDAYEGFEGGVLAVGELGESYDLGKALEDGNGYVVVDEDSPEYIRLQDQPALERCDVERAMRAAKPAAKKATASKDDSEGGDR